MTLDEIENIISSVHYRTRRYRAGSLVVQSGEEVNSLMILLSGSVKGEMVDFTGKVIKIEDIRAPGSLASAFIFGAENKYPVNIIVVQDTELLVIDRQHLLNLLSGDIRILENFLNMISNRSQFLSEKIKFLNFKTIRGKLAQYILQKAAKDSMSLDLGMTQGDLADFFGVARPSVARAIREMEEDGLIEAKGKHIRLIDKRSLAGMISE
jgi:CRP-like cAMP-binding protein